MKVLGKFLWLLVLVPPLAMAPTNAGAADPTVIGLVQCARQGHDLNVTAGSPLTLRVGWAESTRGNLVDLVNGTDVTFTLNGQSVAPATTDLVPVPAADSGTGEDFWRVFWFVNTTAPAAGGTVTWTVTAVVTHLLVDHELIEAGIAPVGQPAMFPAGSVLIGGPFFTCTLHGV